MKKLKFIILTVVLALLGGNPLFAATRQWDVDKAHSGFYFSIDHIFAKVNGFFNEFEIEMHFNPDDLAASRMVFTIKTESVDTNISKRDKHLQSEDFFDAASYPTMTFTSKAITKTGNNSYAVAGVFEVKGEKYDLVLPLELAGMKAHPMAEGKDVVGFNGRLVLDRLAYKIGSGKFAELGVVGREVEVLVSLELLSDRQ